jgi:hypothetical protein
LSVESDVFGFLLPDVVAHGHLVTPDGRDEVAARPEVLTGTMAAERLLTRAAPQGTRARWADEASGGSSGLRAHTLSRPSDEHPQRAAAASGRLLCRGDGTVLAG